MSLKDTRLNRLAKLRKLGLRKGTHHITSLPKPQPSDVTPNEDTVPLHFLNYEDHLQHAVSIEAVIPGQIIQNEYGQYFSFETRYPLGSQYGHQPLNALLQVPMQTVADITEDEAWLDLRWHDVLFLDTETTGLEIAAGTVAFLIGVGFLDGPDFVVRQVFMRDFDEETALLRDLHALCERYQALVSFNGKTFDTQLLLNRFTLARLFIDLFDGPHFDLLHSARRIWRRRLNNCKLATIEAEVLGLTRSQADIPGYFIPSLYRKYLVDQDARTMAGIFYHNELDIVSLAALAGVIGHYFEYPQPLINMPLHPQDMVSLGLWQRAMDRLAQAETTLKEALTLDLPEEASTLATLELAYLLKQQNRHAEAETYWQDLVLGPYNLLGLEELAKYYEWQEKNLDKALKCITYALEVIAKELRGTLQADAVHNWQHRQARVLRKMAA